MELVIKKISKTYSNGVKALRSINLEIGAGMFGLLGPNGAGKSTLMRILATLQQPDVGSVHLDGVNLLTDLNAVRSRLGYLPQEFGVYPDVTLEAMLNHLAILKGLTQKKVRRQIIHELMDRTNLTHVRRQKLGSFSGGMRRRFGVAQALLNNPDLLIVDEPTAGLDPQERRRFHNLLSEISGDRIVLLSTHIVEDVHVLCPGMAILDQGSLRLTGNPGAILTGLRGKIWRREVPRPELAAFSQEYHVIQVRQVTGSLWAHVYCPDPPPGDFQMVEPDLEDAYFYYIKTEPCSSGEVVHVG